MGAVQTGNSDIFRTIVAAVSKHQGLQLVLSIGHVLQPEHVGPVPNNSIVVNNAAQLELLIGAASIL
jgi:hypothetical protein